MEMPISPVYSEASGDFQSHRRRLTSKIDFTKFRTKMCRNYQSGFPCRYKENCAFSHDDGTNTAEVLSPTARTPETTSPVAHNARGYSNQSSDVWPVENTMIGGEMSLDMIAAADTFGVPPPSYEVAIAEDLVASSEEFVMPPAYPTRFRHDPYSYAGVLYEQ